MADDDDRDDNYDDDETERKLKERVDEVDDEDDDDQADDDSDDDSDDDEPLGDKGKRALDRMKAERKQLKADLAKARENAKKWEDSQKTEAQRLSDDANNHKSRADKAEKAQWRLEVALEKGLTRKQAARLSGDTYDELEADADELLELFKDRNASKKPAGKPKEKLSGGGGDEADNEPEETDPKKLAASIPRGRF